MTQTTSSGNVTKADPFLEIKLALARHGDVILREIYDIPLDEQIFYDTSGEERVRGGNGRTTVARCRGTYRVGSQTAIKNYFEIFIKNFKGFNGDTEAGSDYVNRPEAPWISEKQTYDIFRGSNLMPKAFHFSHIRELRNKLVTLPAGNQSLEHKILEVTEAARMSGQDVASAQMKVFLEVVSAQAAFEDYATKRVWPILQGRIADEIKTRGIEPIMPKALRYLRDWLGYEKIEEIPVEIRNKFEHLYTPFAEILDHHKGQIIHGDLDEENIIGKSGEDWKGPDGKGYDGNIRLIDPENVRQGHPFYDTARTATIPMSALEPKHWEELIKTHRKQKWRQEGIRGTRVRKGIWGFKTTVEPEIEEEAERAERSIFFASCVHNPFKIGSRWKFMERRYPEDFREMLDERNYLKRVGDVYNHHRTPIRTALEYICSNPGEFIARGSQNLVSFRESDIETVGELLKFFNELGIVK